MVRNIPIGAKRFISLLAVAAYLLPASLSVASSLGHGTAHFLAEAAEQRRIASALGLTHSAVAEAPASSLRAMSPSETVIHTHGGSTHSHSGPVAELITATAQADGQLGEAHAPAGSIQVHVPVSSQIALATWTLTDAWVGPQQPLLATAESSPQLPPPRA